jgi:tRNA pseudouridine55 synthase
MQGLILLDKPENMTSFSAVSVVRGICGTKRAGHAGTLDPMASGVLPVLLGRATRLCDLMLTSDKGYMAEIQFGTTTDTLDITGKIISETKCSVSKNELESALAGFRGEIMQLPPMYSAIQKDGQRLYDLARRGVEVEREPRKVTIKKCEIIRQTADNRFLVDIICSKGTYIRSLADDIGKFIGCGATLYSLRRTLSAGFQLSDCVTLDDLRKNGPEVYIKSPDFAVKYLPEIKVSAAQSVRFMNGGALDLDRLKGQALNAENGSLMRVYNEKNNFLGLGRINTEKNELAIKCIISGGE